ncbi:MAG: agmatinase [Promethearchaeota archaeon]
MDRSFYTSPHNTFMGSSSSFDKARYVVIGVPFDGTSTYRPGSRFGPRAVREASNNIEGFSLRAKRGLASYEIHDMGDVDVIHGNTKETLERVEKVVKEVLEACKTPILIGGEHTLSYGVMKALRDNVALIHFDAHMDFKDSYMGQKLSHSTVMRRISEIAGIGAIIQLGIRSGSKEEYEFARGKMIQYSSHDIQEKGVHNVINLVKRTLKDFDGAYLTIDMDVLDPAYAPGVGNPEPGGLSFSTLLELALGISETSKRVVGLDVVEIAPEYDNGVTAVCAAKIIFELLCTLSLRSR